MVILLSSSCDEIITEHVVKNCLLGCDLGGKVQVGDGLRLGVGFEFSQGHVGLLGLKFDVEILEQDALFGIHKIVQEVVGLTSDRSLANDLLVGDQAILQDDCQGEPSTLVVQRGCSENLEKGIFVRSQICK